LTTSGLPCLTAAFTSARHQARQAATSGRSTPRDGLAAHHYQLAEALVSDPCLEPQPGDAGLPNHAAEAQVGGVARELPGSAVVCPDDAAAPRRPAPHEDVARASVGLDKRQVDKPAPAVGFGRIVVSEIEAPNTLAVLV
jgi:hypothetical protein